LLLPSPLSPPSLPSHRTIELSQLLSLSPRHVLVDSHPTSPLTPRTSPLLFYNTDNREYRQ
jgi:hypothetical protein